FMLSPHRKMSAFQTAQMFSLQDKNIFNIAIEGVFEISMTLINLVIRLAPYAVACFMFNLAALFGFELIIRLGAYVGVVVLALGLHM
ncbi:cation:dicarboxylase symporter family transporter, partial [Mycobacterium tuberculosis]|nr:cation:dicarboxylase symporter family transporter [Mycobacterium tuberculosis]